MTATEFRPARPANTSARLFHLADAALARLGALVVALRNRRTVNKLLEMDDRMLRDIGLTRGDVYSSLSAPVEEDPSLRLSAAWSERRAALRATAGQRLRAKTRWMEF